MNKTGLLTILLVVCLIVLGFNSWKVFGRVIGVTYANAEAYTAGETEIADAVENLDIHWLDGSVTFAFHAKNTVLIEETSKKSIPDNLKLRWWMDGATLRVQYCKSGTLRTKNLNKTLKITLPEDMKLNDVAISAASGDLNVPRLDADTLALKTASGEITAEAVAANVTAETASGDIRLRHAGDADAIALSSASGEITAELADVADLSAKSTSGDIDLEQAGRADAVRLESTSGEITATLDDVGQCRTNTTSGDIRQTVASAQTAAIKTTSGNVRATVNAFDELAIATSSGDVTLALDAEPGFTAEIKTSSGSFESAIETAKDGKKYTCGDGSRQLSIHTTSGDIRLKDAAEEK